MNRSKDSFEIDIEAVITSFNQGLMILEAVKSLCAQTILPQKIIVVDDGSTDEYSIQVLKDVEQKPVRIVSIGEENE